MLPCFVTRQLAQQVLQVGKAINFLRLCCDDPGWALTPSSTVPPDLPAGMAPVNAAGVAAARAAAPACATYSLASSPAGGGGGAGDGGVRAPSLSSISKLQYGAEAPRTSFVSWAATHVNARLLHLMLGRFELRAHCHNLKQFMLLGKGDFVQHLMESVSAQISRPASKLHRHHLLSLVESAVRTSISAELRHGEHADGEHALLLKHLDVRLSKAPGEHGWDGFSLDYMTEAPTNVVLTKGAMAAYRQAFTFLWRLKRVEYSLTSTWRKHGTTARLVQALHSEPTLKRCHLLRHEMIHFVYNLQARPPPIAPPTHPPPAASARLDPRAREAESGG